MKNKIMSLMSADAKTKIKEVSLGYVAYGAEVAPDAISYELLLSATVDDTTINARLQLINSLDNITNEKFLPFHRDIDYVDKISVTDTGNLSLEIDQRKNLYKVNNKELQDIEGGNIAFEAAMLIEFILLNNSSDFQEMLVNTGIKERSLAAKESSLTVEVERV